MKILSFISEIFKPAAEIIDSVHTSTEEKLKLKNSLTKLENDLTIKILTYETKLLESKAQIITAEANGESWLQRNWRPCLMMTFMFLVVFDSFGWLENPLASEAWVLLQIGMGGYVIGRSVEKAGPNIVKAFKR